MVFIFVKGPVRIGTIDVIATYSCYGVPSKSILLSWPVANQAIGFIGSPNQSYVVNVQRAAVGAIIFEKPRAEM